MLPAQRVIRHGQFLLAPRTLLVVRLGVMQGYRILPNFQSHGRGESVRYHPTSGGGEGRVSQHQIDVRVPSPRCHGLDGRDDLGEQYLPEPIATERRAPGALVVFHEGRHHQEDAESAVVVVVRATGVVVQGLRGDLGGAAHVVPESSGDGQGAGGDGGSGIDGTGSFIGTEIDADDVLGMDGDRRGRDGQGTEGHAQEVAAIGIHGFYGIILGVAR